MNYFDENGRRVPGIGMRVFGHEPGHYYRLTQPELNYTQILDRCKQYNMAPAHLTVADFKLRAESLLNKIEASQAYVNLLGGVHIPFVFQGNSGEIDFGTNLEETLLPNLQKSFNARYPEAHFKAVLQSNSELPGNISLDPASRYEGFVSASSNVPVVGWYFPQALQEFDIRSQRQQMIELPVLDKASVCLSGGMDICAALVGSPDLLISEDFYTPILCMSAYVHADPRLVLLLKAYGPHMEFWCMTQMLTKDTTQVSEQWAGGVTVFEELS